MAKSKRKKRTALFLCVILIFVMPGTAFAEPTSEDVTQDAQLTDSAPDESVDAQIPAEDTQEPSDDEQEPAQDTKGPVLSGDAAADDPGEDISDSSEETAKESGEVLAQAEETAGGIPVYRLYNPKTAEHLFTTDLNEVTVLYRKYGWNWEGIGWYAPAHGKAVYRLYNRKIKQHLFTSDLNEKKILIGEHGWTVDNGGRPLFYSGGSYAVYRLYHRGTGAHHLTLSNNEYNKLPSYGWRREGAVFKAEGNGWIPGSEAAVSGTVSASNVNGKKGTFKVTGRQVASEIGVKKVQFAIWRDADQSDIKWYTASGSGSTYATTANVGNHRQHFGTFNIHMYVTLENGVRKRTAAAKVAIRPDNYAYGAYVNAQKTGCRITIVNAQISGKEPSAVKMAVWSADKGQDDLVWYNASRAGTKTFQTVIDSSKHNGEGTYCVHVYGISGKTTVQLNTINVSLKLGEMTLAKQLAYLETVASTNHLEALHGASITAAQRHSINLALARILNKGKRVGFVLMNLRTGKTLAYNAGTGIYSASTVKGPYVAAVCRANQANWYSSSGLMTRAITVSDNRAYAALRARYGGAPMKSLYQLSRLSYKNPNQNYLTLNPRELAKLWCGTYSYLKQEQTVPKTLRGVLSKTGHSPINRVIAETTYSKPGWLYVPRHIYNDGGIVMSAEGPYVLAVMTTLYGDDHEPVDALVRILHSTAKTM